MKTGRTAIALAVLLVASGIVAFCQTTWITTVVDPLGGASISPEWNMEPCGNGGTLSFTITPSSGWSLNTVEVYRADDLSSPFVLIEHRFWFGPKTRTLSRYFGPGVYEVRVHAHEGIWYLVGMDVDGPGSLTFSPVGQPVSNYGPYYFLYENGTEVTITATPEPWCTFVGWDDGAGWTSTENPLVVTVSGYNWGALATFEQGPPPVTITASAGPGGTIDPTGAVLVASGSDQTFTITPDPDYIIAGVQVDGIPVGAVTTYTFTAVDADHSIAVTFNPVQTWISTVVDPLGGATISPEGTMVPYGEGGTFSFAITPSGGWSLNTVEVYRAADLSQPFQLVRTRNWYGPSPRTLSYAFEAGIYEIRVHAREGSWYVAGVEVVGPGSVTRSPEGEPLPAAFGPDYGLYEDGTEITLTATHDPWCTFVGWDDDAGWTSTENPLTITISGGGWGAYAKFEEGPPPLTITASAGPGGTIEPAGAVLVASGSDQTFTITPDPDYYIVDVQVDGASAGAVSSYTFTDVTANHTISASFEPVQTWISTVVDPVEGVRISPAWMMQPCGSGGTFSFVITPASGWSLNTIEILWSASPSDPLQVIQTKLWYGPYPATLKRVFGPGVFEIRAHARPGRWFVVGVKAQGPGSVALTPAGEPLPGIPAGTSASYGLYEDGAVVTVEATPDPWCVLVQWDDGSGVTSTENPLTHTIAGDAWFVEATFDYGPPPLTITSSAGLGGTISPAGDVPVAQGGSQTYTITPDPHYHVTDVLVDGVSVGAVTSYTFTNVTEARSIAVSFEYGTPVTIPDPGLEAAIRDKLSKPTGRLFQEELEAMTGDLYAGGRSISSLEGIQYCTGLSDLDLHGNDISDISALAGLTSLEWLDLLSNQIVDIGALAGLIHLNLLGLSRNQIADISAVAELTSLSVLYLGRNQIADISALAGLTGLGVLYISWNQLDITCPDSPARVIIQAFLDQGCTVGWLPQNTSSPDAESPLNPTLSSSSHVVGVPSHDTHAVIQASGATDNCSVVGYEYAWTQSPTWTPSQTLMVAEPWAGGTFEATAEGDWYFHVATVDSSGNWSGSTSVGPFEILFHVTITASAGANGSIIPSGSVSVAYGSNQTFTITPDPHYHVADVLVDGISVGAVTSYTFTSVDADHMIAASFAIDTFTLTYAAGAHGTITGTSPQTVNYGADGTEVTATPDTGYHSTSWSDGVLTAARTDTNVTADKSVTASFAINARCTLTMAITPARGGTTVPVVGSRVYDEGTVVDIRATAAGGYRFVRWEGAVTGSANPTTVTMTGNLQVRAVFVRTYTLEIAVAPAGGGIITPAAGTYTYDSGAVVNLTAVPSGGYRFDSWTGRVRSPSSATTTIAMTGNRAVSATFVKTYTMTISVTPVGGGTTSPAIGATTYDAGSLAILRATASPGYRFDHWEGASTRTSERVAVRMDADKTATAVFVKTYTLTFSPSPLNGGTVIPGGTHTYDDGTVVAVRATARTDYHFDHWEGALTGSVNPSAVTMSTDLVLTAVFKRN